MAENSEFFRFGIVPQQSGYHPNARLWVQKIEYSSELGDFKTLDAGTLVELKDWSSLTVNKTRTGEGTMSITIPNPRDKYVRHVVDRTRFMMDDGQQGAFIESYFSYLTNKFAKYVSPLNLEKLRLSSEGTAEAYLKKAWTFGIGESSSNEVMAAFFRDKEDVTGFGRMQRIFLDIQGEDGKWYAGFTGLISSIADNFDVQGEPSIVLSCKDILRIFSLSEIVVQRPLWSILIPTILKEQAKTPDMVQNTFFAFKKVSQIIYEVSRIVQQTFCWPSAVRKAEADSFLPSREADQSYEDWIGTYASKAPESVSSDVEKKQIDRVKFFSKPEFWFKHDFWLFQEFPDPKTANVGSYEGAEPFRRQFINGVFVDAPIDENTTLENLVGQVFIDKYLGEAEESVGYQFAISSAFDVLQPQKPRADAICRHSAELMWCDWFASGNGDIIFQQTKVNNLPGSIDTDVRETDVGIRGRIPKGTMDFFPDGWDFSPGPDYMPQKGHGWNYVVADLSLKGWGITESEEPIVNFTIVPFGGTYEMDSATSNLMREIQWRGMFQDLESQRRFGIRLLESTRIFSDSLLKEGGKISDATGKNIMNMMAFQLAEMMSASAITGSVRLTNRPDLDIGKTVLLYERQKVGYIDTISLSLSKGSSLGVTLSLSFLHDIGKMIQYPWVVVREFIK